MNAPEINTRQMHLGIFAAAAGHHIGGWQIEGAQSNSEDFGALLNIAQTAERGKFDFIFFSDGPVCLPDGPPSFVFLPEPMTLLGAIASRTSRVGLIATVSSTFTEPYNLARAIGSIDHISSGRAGWNVVTTASKDAAANFGRELPLHDLRYEIADEYLQVVQGLWDSWELGGRVANKETGQFIDVSKVHTLDHRGKHFNVRGPLGMSRSPQGQPVIVQAGSSRAGQQFAAKYAEVVFTVQQDMQEAKRFYAGIKEQVAAVGRSPDHCKILPGFYPVVGRTDEEAIEKYEKLRKFVSPGSALATMSERYGHDMSKYSMDDPVPELPFSATGVQTFSQVMYNKARREGLTLKDIHDVFALSRGYVLVRGTPKGVADVMESWLTENACDGFVITPAFFPGAFDDFIELVIPELQRRKLFRADYQGTTLRSHLGLTEPENRFAKSRLEE
jgi:N-acetyl-S-(2-succino)cysteine monooxygenase